MHKINDFQHKTNMNYFKTNMNYFDGQQFTMCNNYPDSSGMMTNRALYYGIQYNHTGPLVFSGDDNPPVRVNGAHVFLTAPGHRYIYGCEAQEKRHHCFICCVGPRMQEYVSGGLFPEDIRVPVPVSAPERFLRTMLEIMSLLKRSPVVPPRAVWLYEDLLLQIAESRKEQVPLSPYCRKKIMDIAELIRLTPERDYDFSAAARDCAVTLIHYRRIFKQLHGVPPHQFLIHCRLQKAASLLLQQGDSLSVSEVAELSGIPDQNYFSRLFKRHFHISPMEYRREFL